MNYKTLAILILILGIIFGLISLKQISKNPVSTQETLISILETPLDIKAIDSLTVGRGEKEYVLHQKKGFWVVPSMHDAPVDMSRIEDLVTILNDSKGELRSSDPNLLSDFGLDVDQAVKLQIQSSSQSEVHLLMASQSTMMGQVFIRHLDSNDVFLVEDDLLMRLGIWGAQVYGDQISPKTWLQFKLLPYQQVGDIDRIKVKHNQKLKLDFVQSKSDDDVSKWNTWRQHPFPLDAFQIGRLVEDVAELRAQDIVAAKTYPDSVDQWTIEVTTQNSETFIFEIKAVKEGESTTYYAFREGLKYHWILPDYVEEQFSKVEDYFFAYNPLQVFDKNVTHIIMSQPTQDQSLTLLKTVDQDQLDTKEMTSKKVTWIKQMDSSEISSDKIQMLWTALRGFDVKVIDDTSIEPQPDQFTLKLKNQGEEGQTWVWAARPIINRGVGCYPFYEPASHIGYCVSADDFEALKSWMSDITDAKEAEVIIEEVATTQPQEAIPSD